MLETHLKQRLIFIGCLIKDSTLFFLSLCVCVHNFTYPVFSQMPFPSLSCLFPLLFFRDSSSFVVTSYEYDALFKFPFSFRCGGRTAYENWRRKKKNLFYLAKIYGKKLKLSLDFAILSKLFKEYKAHIKQLENLFAIRKFLKKRFFQ